MVKDKIKEIVERFGILETLIVVAFLLVISAVSSLVGIFFGMALGIIGIIFWRRWMKKKKIEEELV